MFLSVKVKPNAKITRVTKWIDSELVEIAIHAPPKEGKANAELVRFLAEKLDVAKSSVKIAWGVTEKMKRVEIPQNANLDNLKEDQPRLL